MAKLKIDKDEEIQEGEVVETHWDLKKIIVGGFLLIVILLIGAIVFFPGQNRSPSRQTLGATSESTKPTPPLPDKEDVQGIIENAKSTLSEITSENLTSSEAAIQKVISDLQSLQAGSGSATDIFCKFVCKK